MQIKQVVVTGQYQVELQTVDIPEPELGQGELLIETDATFISAWSELANYSGRSRRFSTRPMVCLSVEIGLC